MKKYLLITFLSIVSFSAYSMNTFLSGNLETISDPVIINNKYNPGNSNGIGLKASVIDALDSVVFDYSKAVVSGDTIEFPISILSDDTVFALDFSFKYNHSELIFDTIFNITPSLQSLYFYNTNDSTLRFTSNTLTYCTNDTVLVLVRFRMINGVFDPAFIYTIKGYLNGNLCSVKTPNFSLVGFPELYSKNEVIVYPNPARESLIIESTVASTIQLFNPNGQLVLEDPDFAIQHKLNTEDLNKGIYFLKITNGSAYITKKVVIN